MEGLLSMGPTPSSFILFLDKLVKLGGGGQLSTGLHILIYIKYAYNFDKMLTIFRATLFFLNFLIRFSFKGYGCAAEP